MITISLKDGTALQKCLQAFDCRNAFRYWPHFCEVLTKEFDPALVFTEIMSFIKGSVEALDSEKGYLSLSEYKFQISERRAHMYAESRDKIYELFLEYEKVKTFKREEFDICDVTTYIYK